MQEEKTTAVVGLGYVGLPLAVEFSKKPKTFGLDINSKRINELKNGEDTTLEVDNQALLEVANLKSEGIGLYLTDSPNDLGSANMYIITVPTPVDKNNSPVLKPLEKASEVIGAMLNKGDIVVDDTIVHVVAHKSFQNIHINELKNDRAIVLM